MNITVNGQVYAVPAEKVQELIAWLNENAARVQEELLNESDNIIPNSGDMFDGRLRG